MTKEEFNKQIKRYFDSINPERGEVTDCTSCDGVMCSDCMFNHGCNNGFEPYDIFEIMEEFEKWVKEHPPTTNKEKMEEVFGVKIGPKCLCPPCAGRCVLNCEECRKWWNEEYQTPKKGAQDESD